VAIKKEIEINDSGVLAEYIKIEFAIVGAQSPGIQIGLHLYKDQAAREAGKNLIHTDQFVLPEDSVSYNKIMDIIYKELKKSNKFNGAVDV